MFLIVMGVCGCGKSTVGESVAAQLSWQFADGDSYHPSSNKEKMSKGISLTDKDRHPWLQELHDLMIRWKMVNQSGVITCSALKRSYRDILVHGMQGDENTEDSLKSANVLFVFLKGTREVLELRMDQREGHFMPSSLLHSQLATLEEPQFPENYLTVDIEDSPKQIVKAILNKINSQPSLE